MRIVYLDQNKWIDLARSRMGVDSDPALRRSLHVLLDEVASGSLVVPVSAAHYMESARIANPRRRQDVGETMWRISRGKTLASYTDITRHEIDLALAARHPGVQARPFSLLGWGVGHAFGEPGTQYKAPAFAAAWHSEEFLRGFEAKAQQVIERALLTGQTPDGSPPPSVDLSAHGLQFMQHLSDLPTTLRTLPRKQWHDALVAMSLADIADPINEALRFHHLDAGLLLDRGRDELMRFLLDLPSRAADLHMHWQIAKNPGLRPRKTDLDDWAALVPAVAYCDVVVCEKHFADLIRRDGFRTRAAVLTDLRELAATA